MKVKGRAMHRFLILGAGPSGLTVANTLLDRGVDDFIVLEKEDEAGGLCRSEEVDGSPLDTGGGHFLDVRRPSVNEFLFRFLPESEWDIYERDSRIRVNGQMVSHPLEANIWQMDIDTQIEYLMSISKAGCVTGKPMPSSFVEWIRWKLGDKISDDYMIPYNTKMFGDELNELGTYWLNKLPDVSFEDTLRSCLEHRAYAKQPGHARFYYPKKYGYGELWKRMAARLEDRIIYNASASVIDFDDHLVETVDGRIFEGQTIITTVPWPGFKALRGMPSSVFERIKDLKYTGVVISYCGDTLDSKAHWIYEPSPDKDYHRLLLRHNFCPGSKGYWKETRIGRFRDEEGMILFTNEYAYPLNTRNKPEIMDELIKWSESRGVYAVGRWGEHEHYNSDAVVERSIQLAERLIGFTEKI